MTANACLLVAVIINTMHLFHFVSVYEMQPTRVIYELSKYRIVFAFLMRVLLDETNDSQVFFSVYACKQSWIAADVVAVLVQMLSDLSLLQLTFPARFSWLLPDWTC
jgi:hypothetical protein